VIKDLGYMHARLLVLLLAMYRSELFCYHVRLLAFLRVNDLARLGLRPLVYFPSPSESSELDH
jgi:hypothetical protein